MADHAKVSTTVCSCGFVGATAKSLSGHVGGSRSKALGASNGRWAGRKLHTSHGYVAVRVPPEHPHAWGPPGLKGFRYAYEHILVAEAKLGRSLREDELVHHKDEDKTNNAPNNLEVLSVSEHAREHAERRGRDELGRFPPADLRVRQFPEARP